MAGSRHASFWEVEIFFTLVAQISAAESLNNSELHFLSQLPTKRFKRSVSRDGYFLGLNILISTYFLYALMVFKVLQSFSLSYTILNLLFASLKLLPNCENAY